MSAAKGEDGGARPSVTVIVPFRGGAEDADRALRSLARLRLGPDDEIVLADNAAGDPDLTGRLGQSLARSALAGGKVRVIEAGPVASSYLARNVAAQVASGEWLLFLDADCVPAPNLIDAFSLAAADPDCGAVSGTIEPLDSAAPLSDWAVSRGVLDQKVSLAHPFRPAAVTACLAVRRSAWQQVGGFLEGIRSGGDGEFCWRLQGAGWSIAHRPEAVAGHRHRETVPAMARQMARYGAGNAWLNRRYPGSSPRPRVLYGLARCCAAVGVAMLSLQWRRARFKLYDAVAIASHGAGYLRSNVTRGAAPEPGEIVLVVDSYPKPSETFVVNEAREIARAGRGVRIEAISRPDRPALAADRAIPVAYMEDEGALSRLRSLLWLAGRHPLRFTADLLQRGRWDPRDRVTLAGLAPAARRIALAGERHIHAHFATAAAVSAQRLGALLGRPFSVTAHGFDIWAEPRDLELKLAGAAFVTTGCRYNARHLAGLDIPGSPAVEVVVMGVDAGFFSRSAPPPGGRNVVAVGRLVEKKGFEFLIDAAARLEREGRALDRVVLVGDGPLRAELEARARSSGLAGKVTFAGASAPPQVRAALEGADLMACPCVVAADGDRDSIPVVLKEAMAMELPIVASDEVGIPELVGEDFGRLVPPRDAGSLAEGIDQLLSLSAQRRGEIGRAGREMVIRSASLATETRRLLSLIDQRGSA